MESLLIPCPKCGKGLRVRDRKLLGRRAKCPACEHRFLLEEPEEVELQLADAAAATGTSARWVPDGGGNVGASQTNAVASSSPGPIIPELPIEDSGTAGLREMKRRNRRRRNSGIAVGGVVAVLIAGTLFAVQKYRGAQPVVQEDPNRPTVNEAYRTEKEQLRENVEVAGTVEPTRGDPVELLMIPAGTSIVVHLHPAEFWEPGSRGEEFRFCLGPLGDWVGNWLQELSRYEPAEMEEAVVCLIPGVGLVPPQVAGTFRLKEKHKKSELLLRMAGARSDDYGHPVYVGEKYTRLIRDEQTIAAVPNGPMAEEMVGQIQYPAPTIAGIEELMPLTDRERHLTMVFIPKELRRLQDVMFDESLRPALNQVLDWLGDDVESVAWSLHLGDQFHSSMLLRNSLAAGTTPMRLQKNVRNRLDTLPQDVLAMVQRMTPEQLGKRKLIGRFPAMTKVFAMATVGGIGDRFVQLTTVLPERAAPNLALASLLTWDQSNRTDFSQPAPSGGSSGSGGDELPALMADRLKRKIEVDFRRTPLQEAFAYISEETKVPIEIDGDALKLAGYTKNMPQTFQFAAPAPATQALSEILKNYDKMVLILDEEKKLLTVMTRGVAEKRKLTPYLPGK